MNPEQIQVRSLPDDWSLPGIPPLLQRVFAARGVTRPDQLQLSLQGLQPWHSLKGIDAAVALLVDAIMQQQRVLVVGDFDVDGATSTAVAIRCLTALGLQQIDYLVPNRFDFGYGLTPELVDVAVNVEPDRKPQLIITVDNGIAADAGVRAAQQQGIPVLVTDHHLPGDRIPPAQAIVNPNQPGCEFPSKSACGCTVIFYVMLALKSALEQRGYFAERQQAAPNLAVVLDLVALATVADVVPLDHNNRILVEQGLRRIRAGHCQPGVKALLQVAGRDPARVVASDFGFVVGPRLNAAGRLDDMAIGIECLLTDDPNRALALAGELDQFNRDRRSIEAGMTRDAERFLASLPDVTNPPSGVCLYQSDWHQGVIGILASRIKEKLHRPVIAFAASDDGSLKGSARSITGLHMRDALDLVDKRCPDAIVKFGGHAMAAGLTLRADRYEDFCQAFTQACDTLMEPGSLDPVIEVDGELQQDDLTLGMAEQLRWSSPWGQAFPEPCFVGDFNVRQQRVVGDKHLKLTLQVAASDSWLDAIWFNVPVERLHQSLDRVRLVYQLDVNEFRGNRSVQLLVRHVIDGSLS